MSLTKITSLIPNCNQFKKTDLKDHAAGVRDLRSEEDVKGRSIIADNPHLKTTESSLP